MIRFEYFTLVEKYGEIGITATEMANYLGVDVQVARNWLSRWTKAGYLTLRAHKTEGEHHKLGRGRPAGTEGRYSIGKKAWGELMSRAHISGGSENVEHPS